MLGLAIVQRQATRTLTRLGWSAYNLFEPLLDPVGEVLMLNSTMDSMCPFQALARLGWLACNLSGPMLGPVSELVVLSSLARLGLLGPVYLEGFRFSYSNRFFFVGLGPWPLHFPPKPLTYPGRVNEVLAIVGKVLTHSLPLVCCKAF